MIASHEPWLVMLSLLVAFQGSYVGLSLSLRVTNRDGVAHRGMLAASAFALAMAIWSMHFVGMLAFVPPIPVDYFVLPTLISFLVCVLFVGIAVVIARYRPARRGHFALSAVVMGGGIATMHYLGMMALHANAHMTHDPVFTVASVVIAVFTSGLALRLTHGGRGRNGRALVASAAILGLAISAMHYTAMAGLELHPFPLPQSDTPVLSRATLAIIVSVMAFLVSGLFLLTLVPDRLADGTKEAASGSSGDAWSGSAPPVSTGMRAFGRLTPPWTSHHTSYEAPPAVRASPPFSACGATPTPAQGVQASGSMAARAPAPAGYLPVEREGRNDRLDVSALVAVHADAHYTRLIDTEGSHFCPWPISRVEHALDSRRFARVHRSHIVDLQRVEGVRRTGETGVLLMRARAEHGARLEVPVARARWSRIRKRLQEIVPDAVRGPERTG